MLYNMFFIRFIWFIPLKVIIFAADFQTKVFQYDTKNHYLKA